VFSRIFALLARRIAAHFEDVMPATATGRQRILDEVSERGPSPFLQYIYFTVMSPEPAR